MKPAFLVYYLVFCVLDERRVLEPEPKSDPSKGRIAGRTGSEPSQERVRSVNECLGGAGVGGQIVLQFEPVMFPQLMSDHLVPSGWH